MNQYYSDYKWIKVKKYVMDESLSWEERYRQLEEHHQKETEFLIAEVRRLAEVSDFASELAVTQSEAVAKAYSQWVRANGAETTAAPPYEPTGF